MPEMGTTKNSHFPTIDITHKPTRLQSDNIIQAGTQFQSEDSVTPTDATNSVPLQHVTLERAIQYYEANARGELSTLYRNTAKWLRQLLAVGNNAVARAVKESEERTNEKAHEVQEGEQA